MTLNSIKHQYRRHVWFGVFIDIWSIGEYQAKNKAENVLY